MFSSFKNETVAIERFGPNWHMLIRLSDGCERKVVSDDLRDLYYYLGDTIARLITAHDVLKEELETTSNFQEGKE